MTIVINSNPNSTLPPIPLYYNKIAGLKSDVMSDVMLEIMSNFSIFALHLYIHIVELANWFWTQPNNTLQSEYSIVWLFALHS